MVVSSLKAANLGNLWLLRKQKVEYLLKHNFGALRIDWYEIYEKYMTEKMINFMICQRF